MALPQKVLEQLGREPPKTPGWSSQLLMFSSTVFFIALVVYLGLVYGYRPYLDSRVAKLQDEIRSFAEEVPLDQQSKIITFYSQIVNLKTALTSHVYSAKLMSWLEKNTQTNVYFTKLGLAGTTRIVTLSGVAKSMPDIAQQIEIFQEQPEVVHVGLGSASLLNNVWQFDLSLKLDPSFFLNSTAQPAPSDATNTAQ